MTRQNYYKQRKERGRQAIEESLVKALVQQERALQPQLGGRKLLCRLESELREAGVRLGRDRFFTLLRRHGLLIERRRSRAVTTNSRHGFAVYGNRLKELVLSGPHQAWVSDITYLRTKEGFMYLSLIMDAYSRKVVGYHCSDTLESQGCQEALRAAIGQLGGAAGTIHHSDRGCQYCCAEYVGMLRQAGLEISMTEQNHCYENGRAERLNGILKQEYGLKETLLSKAQARKVVDQAVWLYNHFRPHVALEYRTPEEVHCAA